jgi:hypothetical protein
VISIRAILAGTLLCSASHATAVPLTVVPADIAVSLTASPKDRLSTGDLVAMTLVVANLGPDPVSDLVLVSSHFTDEIQLTSFDCDGFVSSVADTTTGFYYYFNWYVAGNVGAVSTLDVAQSLTCHFTVTLSKDAPQAFAFAFGLPSFYTDIDQSNDGSMILLVRAHESVPVDSLSTALLLTLVIGACGIHSLKARPLPPAAGARRSSRHWLRGRQDRPSHLAR